MATHILAREGDDAADIIPHRVTRIARNGDEFDALVEAATALCRTRRFGLLTERDDVTKTTRLHFLFLCAEEASAFALQTFDQV